MTSQDPRLVRTHRTAVRVPGAVAPFDTLQVTVRYPALVARNDVERMSGMLAADDSAAPYPVVVVLSGINVSAAGYLDLALDLTRAGSVVVTFDWVGQLFPGQNGLTPGVDLAVVGPETYGTAPTTPALAVLIEALAQMQLDGPLAGLLDLDRIGLFGHSAGGTVALQSVHPDWFPQIRAVATYGAHTMASEQLGFAPRTVLHSPARVPVLLIAGTEDGVVSASRIRYSGGDLDDQAHDPIRRTWLEAIAEETPAFLAHLSGAGHMLPVSLEDPSSAGGFLEPPLAADQTSLRCALSDLLCTFFKAALGNPSDPAPDLTPWVDQPRPATVD